MGTITTTIDTGFRDWVTDGVKASGVNLVDKRTVRGLGPLLEAQIAAAALAGGDLEAANAFMTPLLESAQDARDAAEGARDLLDEALDTVESTVSAQIGAAVSEATTATEEHRDVAQLAQLAAELARDEAGDLIAPANRFVEATLAAAIAAGEAAVAEGVYFKAVGTSEGIAQVRRRTAGGSDLLYEEVTLTSFDLIMSRLSPSASDQSATFQSLVDAAAAANQDVNILRPGIYKVADIVLPARADGAALKIRNADGVILDGSPGIDMFLLDSAGIDLEGGAVQNTRHFVVAVSALAGTDQDENYPAAALLDSPVDRLRLAGVSLSAVKTALYYISNQNADAHIVDRIELTNCTMEGGWAFASVSCAFRHLNINGADVAGMDASDAVNAAGTLNFQHMIGGISIGKGDAEAQPFVRSMDVRNVRVLSVSDNRDGANGAYNTYGIALFGRNLTMDTAYVEDVSNRQCNDAEGYYFKVDGYELTNVSGLNAGVKTGMLMLKGNNLADQASGDKAVGRNGSVYGWRFENTRAFGDTHPDHGYSFGNAFPAIFLQHDEIEIGKGTVIGCGADDDNIGAVYTSNNRTLDDQVIRDVTFRACIGRSNINIAHAGSGGGVFDCKSYGQDGSQLTANSDVAHVRVSPQVSGDLQDFRIEGNSADGSVANGTGESHNIHIVALSGSRIRGATVINNRGRDLDYGDRIEVEGGAPAGTLADLRHDGANYRFGVSTPVSISDAVLWPRVGPNSTNFMVGSSTVDLGSKAAGASSSFNVTVPGARVGDDVKVTPGLYQDGHDAKGVVSANDITKVTVTNNTGGTYDALIQAYRVIASRNRSNG